MTIFRVFETLKDWYDYAQDVGRAPSPGVTLDADPGAINSAYRVDRAANDTERQTMINWDHTWNRKELVVGFRLKITQDFNAVNWCNIFQLNQQNPHKRTLSLYYNHDGGVGEHALQLVSWAPDDDWKLLFRQTLQREVYNNIILEARSGITDGFVRLWVNGVKTYDSGTINLAFTRESFDSLEIGIYCDLNNPALRLYFDEPVIGDNLNEVVNVLSGEPSPPPPPKQITPFKAILAFLGLLGIVYAVTKE